MSLIEPLEQARAAEKAQALFYRALAAEAEARGNERLSERLNELHADEQHHLSRLTARLLELGATPDDLSPQPETAELVNPTTVRVALNAIGGAMTPGVHLTAGAANGIVAADDGGAWAGVVELALPWP